MEQPRRCSACDHPVAGDALFCERCGAALPAEDGDTLSAQMDLTRRRLASPLIFLLPVLGLAVYGVIILAAARNQPDETRAPALAPETTSPGPSPTEEQVRAYVVRTEGCLNMREKPSVKATRLYCLPDGTTVEALGTTKKADGHEWAAVRYRSASGWAAVRWLEPKTG